MIRQASVYRLAENQRLDDNLYLNNHKLLIR